MRFLALITILLTVEPLLASPGPLESYSKYGSPISGVLLDASSTTFAIKPSGNPDQSGVYGLMVVWVTVTDSDNSTTAITMTCTGSHDSGSTDYTLQSVAVAAGVGTSTNSSWVKDPSAITSPKKWPWRVDIEGFPEVECTFTDTGGTSSDTLGVTVSFATKGG